MIFKFKIYLLGLALFLLPGSSYSQILNTVVDKKSEYFFLRSSRYSLLPHKSTYILPIVYNWMPDKNLYKTLDQNARDRGDFYGDKEAEFQISVAIPVVKNIGEKDWDVLLAFTQHSWWQVYNAGWSRPFRETNYTPEIFSRYLYKEPKKIFVFNIYMFDAGYMHQSNGQIQEFSRSWDRLFIRSVLTSDYFTLMLSAWYRIPEKRRDDENPSIYRYMGHGDVELFRSFGGHSLHLKTPLLSRYLSVDIKYSYPLDEGLRWYVSYQSGYGHSLIEYNHQTQRLGVGFTLDNLMY